MRVMLPLGLQRYTAHHQHGKYAYEQQSCARGRKIPRARHVYDTATRRYATEYSHPEADGCTRLRHTGKSCFALPANLKHSGAKSFPSTSCVLNQSIKF